VDTRKRYFDNTWRSSVVAAAGVVLLLGVAAISWAAQPGPKEQQASAGSQVTIDNFAFGPGTLTVPVGTTVTWTNEDDMVHTVTSTTKVFSSSELNTGQSFSYTFTTPGTYPYFCALHPRMTATVIVK